jgi:fructose-1,6-bisphosphatase/inositol monophosphatase family enzyme
MEHDLNKYLKICIRAVTLSHEVVVEMDEKGRKTIKTDKDIVTKCDIGVREKWREYFPTCGVPIKIFTEESKYGPFPTPVGARISGVGDEIDGTFNYNRARYVFPNCSIFTILDTLEPRYIDALVTALLDHNTGNLWWAIKGQGCFFNGKRVYASNKTTLDKDTSIIIDMGPCVKPEMYLRFMNVFGNSWVRNVSSSGIHLAGVASGSYNGWDGFVCFVQKADEAVSGKLLLREGRGYMSGLPDDEPFDFFKTYQIIATGTKELNEEIQKRILPLEQSRNLAQKLREYF